jgi:nucleotide-binding universal stress UspA family protein
MSTAPIVCGVDDSRGARGAVVAAAALGERIGAPLVAVHVAPDPLPFPYGDSVSRERQRHAARRRGDEFLPRVMAETGLDGRATPRVELGTPVDKLVAVASAEEADMLVVGSRGRGFLRAALLGSVSRELVSLAPCPVLVVPPGAGAPPARSRRVSPQSPSVVCGIDGSPESRYAVEAASRLAGRMNNRLVLVNSYEPVTSFGDEHLTHHYSSGPLRSQWRAGLNRLEAAAEPLTDLPEAELCLEPGDPVRELVRVSERECAELMVVGSHGQTSLRAALYGSVAGTLAASARVPVLVVPPGTSVHAGERDQDRQGELASIAA